MIKLLPLAALCTLALAPAALGQNGSGGDVKQNENQGAAVVTYEQRPEGIFEITTQPNGTRTERMITPEEFKMKTDGGEIPAGGIDASHLCMVDAHPRPRRLARGQSGVLKIVATFAKPAVALPGAHIKLELKPIKGLKFGDEVLTPATAGTLEGKYQGVPVYDDYMLFTVPITVEADAASPKEHFLEGTLKLVLTDGRSGQKMGPFTAKVGGRIDIGRPLPVFAAGKVTKVHAKGGKAAGAKQHVKSKTPRKVETKQPDDGPGKTAGPGQLDPNRPGDVIDPPEQDTVDTDTTDGGGLELGLPVIAGGGVLVLLILLLAFRRK